MLTRHNPSIQLRPMTFMLTILHKFNEDGALSPASVTYRLTQVGFEWQG
jgi:hypothetical protein